MLNVVKTASYFSNIILLAIVSGIPLFGSLKKIKVYDSFIDGAKEAFNIIVQVIPYLVGMVVAVGMLRASGAVETMTAWLQPLLAYFGVDMDIATLGFLKPFSGMASNAMLIDIVDKHGANSFVARAAATLSGSAETTFYIMTIYFGVIGIKKTRYAGVAGIIADMSGIFISVTVCRWLLFV